MRKRTYWVLSGVVLSSFLAQSTIYAAPRTPGFDEWQVRTITDPKKPWTVKFNNPSNATFNNNTLYITDEENQKIQSTYAPSSDGMSVVITPQTSYTTGKEYRLHITNSVTSKGGKGLKNQVLLPFILNNPSQENYITDAKISYTSIITSVLITANDQVFDVKVEYNGKKMDTHYNSGNKYDIAIPSVPKGSKIKVYLYDDKDTLLQTKEYTVQ